MSKITDYYKPSYSFITAIAMKLNIINSKKIIKTNKLKQKLITDYYKKIEYLKNHPRQNKITKYYSYNE